MSNNRCPECGRTLKPNARFCSYCGVSLQKPQEKVRVAPSPATSTTVIPKTEQPTPVEEIPPQVEAAFIMRGTLETLRSQKAALDEEQETIKVKQLVGELIEEEAKKQLSELKTRLGPIKKEIEELESKALTPLERFQQEKEVQEGRLHRLEELRKSQEVDDAIYQRLSGEYSTKLAEINQQLEKEISTTTHWLAQLENRKQQLELDRETLQIRARIDEVSKREVKTQLKGIDEEINKLTSVIAGIRSLLGSSAPPPPTPDLEMRLKSSATQSRAEKALNKCPHCQAKITPGSKYCYSCGRLLRG
jgi:DNA repair exonuclease SbcCD ATPase subunit